MNWKGCRRKLSLSNAMYYPGICLKGLSKTTKNIRDDSRSSSRDLDPGTPEYEARVLPNRPRHSVQKMSSSHSPQLEHELSHYDTVS